MNTIVIDTETNGIGGFRPVTQRMMQLGFIVKNDDGSIKEVSHLIRGVTEINPDVPHKITKDMCDQGVELEAAINDLINHMSTCKTVIGHNLDFDLNVIRYNMMTFGSTDQLREFNEQLQNKHQMCTMKKSIGVCKLPGKFGYKYPKLIELYTHLFPGGEEIQDVLHDALEDARITLKCHDEMKRLKKIE